MALVSEPGSGTGWVKKGARLGHFVVDKVERGTLVYRDGDRLCEVAENEKNRKFVKFFGLDWLTPSVILLDS